MKWTAFSSLTMGWVIAGAAVGLAVPSGAEGADPIGEHTVRSVIFREAGNYQATIGPHPNPSKCSRPDKLMVAPNHPARDLFLATLVAAKASEGTVEIVVDGCISAYGQTFPRLHELAWR